MARCEFICASRTASGNGDNLNFVFTPTSNGSGDVKSFWKHPPAGKLELSCLDPSIDFIVGQKYFIDISFTQEGV